MPGNEDFLNEMVSHNSLPLSVSVLKRVTPKNALKKNKIKEELPDALKTALSPSDFGIHTNLPLSKIIELAHEVYGPATSFPESVKETILEASKTKLPSSNNNTCDILEKSDCYFPLDGYNYEQHLRSIRPEAFVPATTAPQTMLEVEEPTPEEKEVLLALENPDDYESVSDDVIANVFQGVDDKSLLWGDSHNACHEQTDQCRDEINRLLKESRQLDGLSENETEACLDDVALQHLLATEYNTLDTEECDKSSVINGKNPNDIEPLLNDFLNQKKKKYADVVISGTVLTQENHDAPPSTQIDSNGRLSCLDEQQRKQLLDMAERLIISDTSSTSSETHSDDQLSQRWDCETILTTRTNTENHPGRVFRPPKSLNVLLKVSDHIHKARTVGKVLSTTEDMLPSLNEDMHNKKKSSAVCSGTDDSDSDVIRLPPIVTKRPCHETPEEKRKRKNAVKQAQRLIRQSKKETMQFLKAQKNKVNSIKFASNDTHCGIRHIRL